MYFLLEFLHLYVVFTAIKVLKMESSDLSSNAMSVSEAITQLFIDEDLSEFDDSDTDKTYQPDVLERSSSFDEAAG